MPIKRVQVACGICDDSLRCLLSAFPVSDQEPAAQVRKLLDGLSSLEKLLVQGAFVLRSKAFAEFRE